MSASVSQIGVEQMAHGLPCALNIGGNICGCGCGGVLILLIAARHCQILNYIRHGLDAT